MGHPEGRVDVVRGVRESERADDTELEQPAFMTPTEALQQAIIGKKLPDVKAALAKGADPNIKWNGRTALITALWRKSEPIAHALLDAGARADGCDDKQATALHWLASRGGDVKLAQRLIKAGADVNARDEDLLEGTPLHYALRRKSRAFAELLIEQGADLEARTGYQDQTPLLLMCQSESGDMAAHEIAHARWLVELGAKTDAVDDSGSDVILLAAASGGVPFIEFLADRGVKSRADKHGNTPLHVCWNWNDRATKATLWTLLLKSGCDVNAKNNAGNSPLHEAVSSGSKEGVKFLLAHGADLALKDGNGRTALEAATEGGDKKVIALFKGAAPTRGAARR